MFITPLCVSFLMTVYPRLFGNWARKSVCKSNFQVSFALRQETSLFIYLIRNKQRNEKRQKSRNVALNDFNTFFSGESCRITESPTCIL